MMAPKVEKQLSAVGGVGLIILAITCSVSAQESDQPIEEVIVTATKMGGTILDTPLSISLLTGDQLQESGIFDLNDLPNVAPGIEVENGFFGPVISIRGITTTDSTPKGNEGIGYLIDGVNVGRPTERAVAFFDVARMEVLRGPQGTLFGKATSGGVVNIVTRRPGNEYGGSVSLEMGNFGTLRANAGFDIPVNDKVKLRLALNSNNTDGWIEPVLGDPAYRLSDLNDEEDTAARLSAVMDFSDTSSLFLTATVGERDGRGNAGIPFGVLTTESGSAQRQAYGNFVVPNRDEDYWNITAEYTTRFGGVDLTYVGGFRRYSNNTISSDNDDPTIPPIPGLPIPGNYGWRLHDDEQNDSASHELRLYGQAARFDWVTGVNWSEEDIDESNHTWELPLPPPGVPLDIRNSINGIHPLNNTKHESVGVFGQLNYALTEDLTLVAGLRWSEDSVSRRGTFALGSGFPPGPPMPGAPPNAWLDPTGVPCIAPEPCIGVPNNADQEDDKVTWRLGLDYRLNAGGLIYGSIATGYKAGGFSDFGPAGPLAGADLYEPEELTAYEVGYKGDITDTLSYTSAIYYYDYEQMQLSYTQEVAFNTFVLFTVTAPAEVMGWENELTWRLDDFSQIDFELRLSDSEYVDFYAGARNPGTIGPGVPFTSWDGLELDSAPELVAAVAYSRDFVLNSGATISGRIRTKYSDGYILSVIPDAYRYEQDSFTRTDMNLTYRSPGGALSVGLYARNLEDDLQVNDVPAALSTDPARADVIAVGVNRPRTYGISFRYEF